jgi:hypothetical protein
MGGCFGVPSSFILHPSVFVSFQQTRRTFKTMVCCVTVFALAGNPNKFIHGPTKKFDIRHEKEHDS